jgi:hypothetical protein
MDFVQEVTNKDPTGLHTKNGSKRQMKQIKLQVFGAI